MLGGFFTIVAAGPFYCVCLTLVISASKPKNLSLIYA